MTQQTASYPLYGGLDLVTPAMRLNPSRLIAGVNYESNSEGYRRIDGYERFDGRPKPSEASYWLINFDAGVATIAEGATVTGATSGATGTALIAMVVETGTFGGSDAAGYLILTNVVGTFQNNENLQVAAVTKCVANGTATEEGADNDTDNTTWLRDAIETARSAIQAVPGSGRIRGVWQFNGVKYAWRDNAGATACVMWKSTTAGWSAVSTGRYLKFTGGSAAVTVGQTITGATSGATGVVTGVALRTGTYGAGTAAGTFTFATITGTFQNAENLQVAAVTKAVASGADAAITFPAGGRYFFRNHNFFGASDRRRMYFCNGVGVAMEFDGTTLVPLYTGMTVDTPERITVHKNHLCLAFPGGSFQNSGTGDPYAWTPITGAAEIGMGDDITDFLEDVNGVLVIFARGKVGLLYGSSSADWSLDIIADQDTGALPFTAQRLGRPLYMDDRGVRNMSATQAFGDFKMGTLTQNVFPLLRTKKKNAITPIASVRVRGKDQYRLFFSDSTGITIYIGAKEPHITIFDLPLVVYTICSGEDSSGNEEIFFGSDDGYVYQMDAGTSFDGASVPAYCRPAFNNLDTPTQNKRFHKVTLDVDATPTVTLLMTAEFSYGDPDQPGASEISLDVSGGGSFWDETNWNEFYWSSATEGIAECHVDGIGTNMSFCVASNHTYEEPHTIHGATLHYSMRGLSK